LTEPAETEPLIVEFEVDAPARHAFDIWTSRCATWWPPRHTFSGDPAAITFEPRPGGRIVELAPNGLEYEWGEVLDWEPPLRLRYLWHLFFDRDEATVVEITFTQVGDRTTVRLEQRGWERLGVAGAQRRDRTLTAWAMITGRYAQAISEVAGPCGS
jgi:uncharacterized protein YndB with AHSA1/START domain